MLALLLGIHILSAGAALLAATVGLSVRKGSDHHRLFGRIFVYCMVVMALTVIPGAYAAGKHLDMLSSLLVIYLVVSAWRTLGGVRARGDTALSVFGLFIMLAYAWVGWVDVNSPVQRPGVPKGVGLVFATVMAGALYGDARRMLRGLQGSQRLRRHVWRLCFALFMATASFFLSRMHLFPQWWNEAGLPAFFGLLPLMIAAYWSLRLRFGKGISRVSRPSS